MVGGWVGGCGVVGVVCFLGPGGGGHLCVRWWCECVYVCGDGHGDVTLWYSTAHAEGEEEG